MIIESFGARMTFTDEPNVLELNCGNVSDSASGVPASEYRLICALMLAADAFINVIVVFQPPPEATCAKPPTRANGVGTVGC